MWQKLFRFLWRLNALLILIAAGAVVFVLADWARSVLSDRAAARRRAEASPPIAVTVQPDLTMSLAPPSAADGTDVLQAALLAFRRGAYGGDGQLRNILFIQPGRKTARWLLPDNRHVIAERSYVLMTEDGRRTVAVAALVKPATENLDATPGTLVLFDPAGAHVVEAADRVGKVQITSLRDRDIHVLFERDRRMVLATFDAVSFAKREELEIEVPTLN